MGMNRRPLLRDFGCSLLGFLQGYPNQGPHRPDFPRMSLAGGNAEVPGSGAWPWLVASHPKKLPGSRFSGGILFLEGNALDESPGELLMNGSSQPPAGAKRQN